jgi:hypothetical protein
MVSKIFLIVVLSETLNEVEIVRQLCFKEEHFGYFNISENIDLNCKNCKTFCKFEVILSRFIYGAYFEFYGCFL